MPEPEFVFVRDVTGAQTYRLDVVDCQDLGGLRDKARHVIAPHLSVREVELYVPHATGDLQLLDDTRSLASLENVPGYAPNTEEHPLLLKLLSSPAARRRKPGTIIPDLTAQIRDFAKNVEVSERVMYCRTGIPYLRQDLKRIFLRRCYSEIYALLQRDVSGGHRRLGIAGTAGIGKSLFFVYLLYRFMHCPYAGDTEDEGESWRPRYIFFHCDDDMLAYDLVDLTVEALAELSYEDLRAPDTLYVTDGSLTEPLVSSGTSLGIQDAQSTTYWATVGANSQKPIWCLPVWTWKELEEWRKAVHPSLTSSQLKKRYQMYGGVPRILFSEYGHLSGVMESALMDMRAVTMVSSSSVRRRMNAAAHVLLHLVPGCVQGEPYQYLYPEIASELIAMELWKRHPAKVIYHVSSQLKGSFPHAPAVQLFRARSQIMLTSGGHPLSRRFALAEGRYETVSFNRKPRVAELSLSRTERLRADTFYKTELGCPIVDAVTSEGMFRFVPYPGLFRPSMDSAFLRERMEALCALLPEPKLYFVVPHFRLHSSFVPIECNLPERISQFVLEVPMEPGQSIFHYRDFRSMM